ncbi:MAG: DUF6056 family protein [Methylibium sp.]
MSGFSLLRSSASVGLLVALAIIFLYISSLSPIVLDMWRSVALGASFDSLTDFLAASFDAYVWNYMWGNPRLGELFLYFSGASKPFRMLMQFLSLVALVMVAFTIITGRLFQPWRPADALTVVLFLALLWIGHRETAREFFYVPYTSNYLVAYAILLAFLIPYRLALLHPSFPRERRLTFALPPFGVAAGLTNEHTVPVYIAMIGIALAFAPMPAQRWRWMASGLAGLVIGFVVLFFAPGQASRYQGIKYSAFDLDGKLHAAGELITHFTARGGALLLLVGLAVATARICSRRDRWREITAEQRDALTIAALLTIAAIGMVAPLLVSPMLVHRLFFASHVNLAMATTTVLLAISAAPAWRTLLGVTAIGVNAAFFAMTYRAYSAYDAQFVERVASIQSQKAAGASTVVMLGYTLKFSSLKRFITREACVSDPKVYPNPEKAKYFGVESVAMDCPKP